jgi:hypothetical protein
VEDDEDEFGGIFGDETEEDESIIDDIFNDE